MRRTVVGVVTAAVAMAFGPGCQPPRPGPPAQQAQAARVRELVARLNENPDKLHNDHTPAVRKLVDIGLPALPAAVEPMLSEDKMTRLRAQRVLEGVTLEDYGFVPGRGWPERAQEEKWRRFWAGLGPMRWDADAQSRAASAALWRKWLADRSG